jgi:hypothetical protein
MSLIYGNVYSFEYRYLKPGFTKWKRSRIWLDKQDRLKGYYLMTTKIPNIDIDFYVFVSKESNGNYYIYYALLDNIILNPIKDNYDQELDIIKNGFIYYFEGIKVQLKDPEFISNIELLSIKHYIRLNDCLDNLNSIDYPDNFNIINHYTTFTPKGEIKNKKLESIYNSIKLIGYFISLSPPVKNRFSGGALYKRNLLDFNLVKNNLN